MPTKADQRYRAVAEPDFGSRFTGSFTDCFRDSFDGAVTRVKHNQNVCLRL